MSDRKQQITMTLDPLVVDLFGDIASEHDRSLSWTVNAALRWYLANQTNIGSGIEELEPDRGVNPISEVSDLVS